MPANSNPHDAFKALGPIDWTTVNRDDLPGFLKTTCTDAQCLIDSVPVSLHSKNSPSSSTKTPQRGIARARSSTDPDTLQLPGRSRNPSEGAIQLRKEWKEIPLSNPRDNPLGVNVYRLASKDRRGAWFARRSVHEGLSFERWKLAMEREFAECLKVRTQSGDGAAPGEGRIRGIGADKKVESRIMEDGSGKLEVYQLSAQFPGPTAPREFIAMLLTSDCALDAPPVQQLREQEQGSQGKDPRYFMVVSKPCTHPECPPRSGYTRGQYESVELIREIKIERPLRKVRSSVDLNGEEVAMARQEALNNLTKDAIVRSARQSMVLPDTASDTETVAAEGRRRGKTITGTSEPDESEKDYETVIEWLMVTRSDPGGSVPRFMVEKGTPAGIAGDANKFLTWISSKKLEDFSESDAMDAQLKLEAKQAEKEAQTNHIQTKEPTKNLIENPGDRPSSPRTETMETIETVASTSPEVNAPTGFYGMVSNALGVAGGVMASKLPNNPFGSMKGGDTEPDDSDLSDSFHDDEDDTSSIHSFHSLDSGQAKRGEDSTHTTSQSARSSDDVLVPTSSSASNSKNNKDETQSNYSHSSSSLTMKSDPSKANNNKDNSSSKNTNNNSQSQHEKDLRKFEDRQRRATEKLRQAQERALSKKAADAVRDKEARTKLLEKHARDAAKQEEKYQRELARLEAKRANEARKADEKQRKAGERQDKADLRLELDKTRAERDVARAQILMLRDQVGELQGLNTKLVAALGKHLSAEKRQSASVEDLMNGLDARKMGTAPDVV